MYASVLAGLVVDDVEGAVVGDVDPVGLAPEPQLAPVGQRERHRVDGRLAQPEGQLGGDRAGAVASDG